MERREKICLFVPCLLPRLPLTFGLLSILPASKSFKQFKRYMLLKNLKTNYKLNFQKRRVKTSGERKGKREEKNQEKGERKGEKEGCPKCENEGCPKAKRGL